MFTTQQKAHLSAQEFEEEVRALSDGDWARLRKIAAFYSRPWSFEPDELISEAFLRMLDGDRLCPRSVDIVRCLSKAIQSIASTEASTRIRRTKLLDRPHDVLKPTSHSSPLFAMERQEEARRITQVKKELFADDPIAQDVFDGILEEMSSEDIRHITGLDEKSYRSKRKLVRRRIEKNFSTGWTP